jgi:hypothetical protein
LQILDFTENKLKFFTEHVWISLFLVCIGGLVLRLFYFPYNLPIILDGLYYFWFAYDVSMIGHLPTEYYIENDGWPIFLGLLLKFFHFENFLDYVTFQRIITGILSIATALPIFLLCKKFFNQKYALIGAAIFVFEPRLIQNSLLGITEPLYLLLISISLVLFFSENKKFIFISFAIVALATIVRSEAVFLFIAFSILYVLKFRTNKQMIVKYVLAIIIFVLVLLPSVSYRVDNYGHDGILNKIIRSTDEIKLSSTIESSTIGSSDWILFLINGLVNTIKFLGWDLIPIFIIFVPIGFVLVIKRRNFKELSIILILFMMSGPAWFAYLNNSDTRFLFVLYPLFCTLSLFTIEKFVSRFKKKNLVIGMLFIGILVGSISFLEYKKIDYEYERDMFEIAGIVSQMAGGINTSTEINKYIKTAEINEKWPNLPKLNSDNSVPSETKRISDESFNSIKDFIINSKNKGLTHLVIDENTKNRELENIFYDSEKYRFLEKEYDSKDENKKLWVKIFKINFDKLIDS